MIERLGYLMRNTDESLVAISAYLMRQCNNRTRWNCFQVANDSTIAPHPLSGKQRTHRAEYGEGRPIKCAGFVWNEKALLSGSLRAGPVRIGSCV